MSRINDLIYHLQGTCISLEEACTDLGFDREDLTIEELKELDNWLFLCDNCGWWYNVGERACIEHSEFYDDNICIHCAPEFYSDDYQEY